MEDGAILLGLDPALHALAQIQATGGDSAKKMGAFLTHLSKTDEVAASTQNQAFNAILYMYRTLDVELGEVKSLRAKAGKFERHAPSMQDIKSVRDVADDLPIQVPTAMGRRSKSLCRQWGWMFVFPGHVPVKHPRSGGMVRFSLHPGNIQREVSRACRLAKLTMPFTPHHLRHSYATHCLDSGANVHDVSECLGHASLETTKLYLHPQVDRVKSPLELLQAAG